eukprot:UN17000
MLVSSGTKKTIFKCISTNVYEISTNPKSQEFLQSTKLKITTFVQCGTKECPTVDYSFEGLKCIDIEKRIGNIYQFEVKFMFFTRLRSIKLQYGKLPYLEYCTFFDITS